MRGDITFLPPRISTTDSVGMTTWPILSVRPNASTRPSRLSFTFFSKPEYVWTMYHCLVVGFPVFSVVPLISDIMKEPLPRAGQQRICQQKVASEKGHGHDNHDGRGP